MGGPAASSLLRIMEEFFLSTLVLQMCQLHKELTCLHISKSASQVPTLQGAVGIIFQQRGVCDKVGGLEAMLSSRYIV